MWKRYLPLSHTMEEQSIEDYVVDNASRTIEDTAREVLRVTHWLDT